MIEDIRWWFSGLVKRWRGEAVTGVHASLAEAHAEIYRLECRISSFEAALEVLGREDIETCSCVLLPRYTPGDNAALPWQVEMRRGTRSTGRSFVVACRYFETQREAIVFYLSILAIADEVLW
jgi:LmbE family N-acetylglucosaminyl deacetylase